MRYVLNHYVRKFVKDERGVTLVEYGIAITLAVAVGTGALLALSGNINGELNQAGGVMTAN